MPTDLHERLSEFSFGYGATREAEKLLAELGLVCTPFFPNLRQERRLGFDVAFDRPGVPLLIQFKLGEQLARFRKTDPTDSVPALARPFWRFMVDTLEPNGQFELLMKAERRGSEVLYVAPRFSNWTDYREVFIGQKVLESSLLISPVEIDSKLVAAGKPDGTHKIVYDNWNVFACSEPVELSGIEQREFTVDIQRKIESGPRRFSETIRELARSFDDPRDKRVGPFEHPAAAKRERMWWATDAQDVHFWNRDRTQRFQRYREAFDDEDQAIYAAVGYEYWISGIQMLSVTLSK
jgi:hypothetical protein